MKRYKLEILQPGDDAHAPERSGVIIKDVDNLGQFGRIYNCDDPAKLLEFACDKRLNAMTAETGEIWKSRAGYFVNASDTTPLVYLLERNQEEMAPDHRPKQWVVRETVEHVVTTPHDATADDVSAYWDVERAADDYDVVPDGIFQGGYSDAYLEWDDPDESIRVLEDGEGL